MRSYHRMRQASMISPQIVRGKQLLTLIREMGPVLAAIMITARAGSAMTAEIGIQRISEQIDALSTMRIDPLGYLISPRIAAAIVSFPILTAFFDLIGIIGAWVSGCLILGVNSGSYFYRVVSSTQIDDITGGFIKSIVFGLLMSTILVLLVVPCLYSILSDFNPVKNLPNG